MREFAVTQFQTLRSVVVHMAASHVKAVLQAQAANAHFDEEGRKGTIVEFFLSVVAAI